MRDRRLLSLCMIQHMLDEHVPYAEQALLLHVHNKRSLPLHIHQQDFCRFGLVIV